MKIFRAYIITAIICISVTALAASIFIADENARKITLGEKPAVVVMNSENETLQKNAVDASDLIHKIKNAAKRAASIAPPPVNNIYWIVVSSEKTEN